LEKKKIKKNLKKIWPIIKKNKNKKYKNFKKSDFFCEKTWPRRDFISLTQIHEIMFLDIYDFLVATFSPAAFAR